MTIHVPNADDGVTGLRRESGSTVDTYQSIDEGIGSVSAADYVWLDTSVYMGGAYVLSGALSALPATVTVRIHASASAGQFTIRYLTLRNGAYAVIAGGLAAIVVTSSTPTTLAVDLPLDANPSTDFSGLRLWFEIAYNDPGLTGRIYALEVETDGTGPPGTPSGDSPAAFLLFLDP